MISRDKVVQTLLKRAEKAPLSEKAQKIQDIYSEHAPNGDSKNGFGCHTLRLPRLLSAILGERIEGTGYHAAIGWIVIHKEVGPVYILELSGGTVRGTKADGTLSLWMDPARLLRPTEEQIQAWVKAMSDAKLEALFPDAVLVEVKEEAPASAPVKPKRSHKKKVAA